MPLAFAVQNGASYSGAIVKNELTTAGIELDWPCEKRTFPAAQSQVLVKTESKPRHRVVKSDAQKSDNMIADTVFVPLGVNIMVFRELAFRIRCGKTSTEAKAGSTLAIP